MNNSDLRIGKIISNSKLKPREILVTIRMLNFDWNEFNDNLRGLKKPKRMTPEFEWEDIKCNGCTQFPFCMECSDENDVPHRVCGNCYLLEWDEEKFCECGLELVHDCKKDYWYCEDDICKSIAQSDYEAGLMHEYELEKAGGLDEVQRQERLRYYGEE